MGHSGRQRLLILTSLKSLRNGKVTWERPKGLLLLQEVCDYLRGLPKCNYSVCLRIHLPFSFQIWNFPNFLTSKCVVVIKSDVRIWHSLQLRKLYLREQAYEKCPEIKKILKRRNFEKFKLNIPLIIGRTDLLYWCDYLELVNHATINKEGFFFIYGYVFTCASAKNRKTEKVIFIDKWL